MALALIGTFAVGVGCTSSQAFVVTGESVIGLGETYAATGHMMDVALDAKKVTVEQYRVWASFSKRFQLVYVPAGDLWKAALLANDAPAAQQAAVVLGALAFDLAQFATLLSEAR